jgi:hypothetical protein
METMKRAVSKPLFAQEYRRMDFGCQFISGAGCLSVNGFLSPELFGSVPMSFAFALTFLEMVSYSHFVAK